MNKIFRFFSVALAGCAVSAAFTSCSEDNDPTYLNEVTVSQSVVALSADGDEATIEVNAIADWAFAKKFQVINGTDTTYEAAPAWLTLTPQSGEAGQTTVSLKAPATTESYDIVLELVCAGKTQLINVIQQAEKTEVPLSTCAEIIAGPESKTYRVKGSVKSIANTEYGNWYIQDETGEVYVYGTRDKSGNNGKNNSIAAWGLEVGDEVIVEGPKTVYNGTVELVDVTVINITKSLVKLEEGASAAFDANGGDYVVRVAVSGDGPFVSVNEEAQSWIGISSIEKTDTTTNIRIHVAANEGEAARTGVISFTSSKDGATSVVTSTVSQMGLSGTLTNPFNVADAIAYCQTLDGATANDFYVKGKISRIIDGGEFGSYGNATFYISDDGEYNGEDDKNCDTAHDFEVYRAIYLGNEKWTEGHANISVGDEVIICGKLTLYKGISETSQNAAYIYSINGVTTDENGVGSLAYPFNVAGAISCIDNKFAGNVFVKGIISEIANNGEFGSYGNATFWISDDGARHNDAALDFEAYRALYLGNRKWQEGDTQIAVGDEVIMHGQITKYGSTYETSSGKAYIYSLNGKTE